MRLQNLIKRMSCFVLIAALILSLGSFAMADSTSLSSDAEEYIYCDCHTTVFKY